MELRRPRRRIKRRRHKKAHGTTTPLTICVPTTTPIIRLYVQQTIVNGVLCNSSSVPTTSVTLCPNAAVHHTDVPAYCAAVLLSPTSMPKFSPSPGRSQTIPQRRLERESTTLSTIVTPTDTVVVEKSTTKTSTTANTVDAAKDQTTASTTRLTRHTDVKPLMTSTCRQYQHADDNVSPRSPTADSAFCAR